MTMADGDAAAGLAEALSGAAGEGTDPSGQADPTLGQADPNAGGPEAYNPVGLSPQAQTVIAGLPEGERAAAAKYIREWDSKGFQPYAQRVQGQLQPYVQLGSPDELRQIKSVFEQLKADPQGFVNALIENGFVDRNSFMAPPPGQAQGQPQQQFPGYDPNSAQPPVMPNQPPDIANHPQFKRMEQALGALAQQFTAQQSAAEAREADQALERLTQEAEAKHGTFDRMYVYQLMAANKGELSMDAAVQVWKNNLATYAQTQQPKPPGVMSASSAPPAAPGPLLSSDDRATALANALRQLGQN